MGGLFPKDRDLSRPLDRIDLRVRASDFRSPVDEFALRLDRFLAERLTWRSRTSIQDLIREGRVLVDASTPDHPEGDGELVPELRPGRKVRHGSRVVVMIPEHARVHIEPAALADLGRELAVLYEDECALAIDKPPMLAVHPGGRHLTDTLIQRVHALLGSDEAPREGRPRLCHRLDRETSGVVLIGKDPASHSNMMLQFENRQVEKEYLAIVHGAPDKDGGRIDLPLGPARASRVGLKMAVAMDGQASVTDWRVVERLEGCALVSCKPLTGRQHQIRVHMEALGHPLVGDKLYCGDELLFDRNLEGKLTPEDVRALELPRHALHNHRLAFTTPATGARVVVTSPLARDLALFLEQRRSGVTRAGGAIARELEGD